MRVSVVIPAYNAEKYLGETVESVLDQTITDWELVVVDDGSTDGTAEVARAYAHAKPRVRLVHQANGGVVAARNRGFAQTSRISEYVAFLDADDVWEQNALASLMKKLDGQPRAVAAHGLARYINDGGQPFRPGELEIWSRMRHGVVGKHLVPWPIEQPTTLGILAYRNVIATPGTALVRRSALDATGAFDPATVPCEDWDMWLRLSQRGDIIFADRVVLNYRFHADNLSHDVERMQRGQYSVRRKLLSSTELTREQQQIALVANWFWGLQLCSMQIRWAKHSLLQGRLRDASHQLAQVIRNYVRCFRGLPASS